MNVKLLIMFLFRDRVLIMADCRNRRWKVVCYCNTFESKVFRTFAAKLGSLLWVFLCLFFFSLVV